MSAQCKITLIATFAAIGLIGLHLPAFAVDTPEIAYMLESTDSLVDQYAPIFLIEENELSHNKIGTPSARYSSRDNEEIYVDSSIATLYHETHTFTTKSGTYTNLVYRIHFEESPFTWKPLNIPAGKNVGAMVVITLDEENRPVFVSTVQSCGCYHAIVPTNLLAKSAYAEAWSPDGSTVFGELLPGQLDFLSKDPASQKIVVSIRSSTHRTKGLSISSPDKIRNAHPVITMKSSAMESLKALPLGDTTTSFYHERGRKRGLVKGAYKPLETMIFGAWAWDSHVGQDREYGSKEDTGRRFYTTLQFSKKKKADMWDYASYLRHNGWKP